MAACGGGGLSLEDYAVSVESLVTEMNGEVDDAMRPLDGSGVNTAMVAEAFGRRAAARAAFRQGLEDLEPPDEAADLHAEALVLVERLRDAEAALAAKASGSGDLADVFASAESRRLEEIDDQVVALCGMAEAAFDATDVREGFSGSSWMPASLKAVVDVAFRCTAEERQGS